MLNMCNIGNYYLFMINNVEDVVGATNRVEVIAPPDQIDALTQYERVRCPVGDLPNPHPTFGEEQAVGEDEKRMLIEDKIRISCERRELSPDDWTTTARRLRADPNS